MVGIGKDTTMSETADHTTTDEKRETLISSARGTVNRLGATADDLSHQVRRLSRVALVLLVFTIALIIITIVLEVQVSQRNRTIKEVKASVALTQDAVNKTQILINTATGTPEQVQAQQKATQAALDAISRTEAKVDALIAKSP
jgi:predicted PurR-regulated permease PerM